MQFELLPALRAVVVAQQKCACLVTGFESRWVLGFFSLLYPLGSVSLIQVPRGGATLLISYIISLAVQLQAKQA